MNIKLRFVEKLISKIRQYISNDFNHLTQPAVKSTLSLDLLISELL